MPNCASRKELGLGFAVPVPCHLPSKGKLGGSELDRLEEAGVLRKVEHSEWVAPIVLVPKKDRSLRLCGDYKATVNPALNVDQYPLPKPADLLSSLAGGQRFSKRPHRSLPASSTGRDVFQAHNDKHAPGVIRLYSSALWCCLSACSFP